MLLKYFLSDDCDEKLNNSVLKRSTSLVNPSEEEKHGLITF